MAYLARIEAHEAAPIALSESFAAAAAAPGFSELEWSVIRLSRVDALWTIRKAGPLRRLWNRFIGRGNPMLTNTRLEALRRIAVLSRHFGFSVPGEDVADFLSEGFTGEQYELLVTSVRERPQLQVISGGVLA